MQKSKLPHLLLLNSCKFFIKEHMKWLFVTHSLIILSNVNLKNINFISFIFINLLSIFNSSHGLSNDKYKRINRNIESFYEDFQISDLVKTNITKKFRDNNNICSIICRKSSFIRNKICWFIIQRNKFCWFVFSTSQFFLA